MWTFAYFESYFVPLDDLDLTTLCYTVDEMYLASLINKGREAYISGTTLPSETVLKMATINGAKAVLWDNEIGSLEVGKKVMLLVAILFM
jgi:cytosine/adenosine deaminase-related metal-dependent hydrolase